MPQKPQSSDPGVSQLCHLERGCLPQKGQGSNLSSLRVGGGDCVFMAVWRLVFKHILLGLLKFQIRPAVNVVDDNVSLLCEG